MTAFGARLPHRPAPRAGRGVNPAANAVAVDDDRDAEPGAPASGPTTPAPTGPPPGRLPGTPAGRAAGPDGRPPWWRRLRLPLLATLVVLLLLLFLALANSRSVRGELDPNAVDVQGSRALATLLGERGVAVQRITRLSDAVSGAGERSVVFIPFPNLLPAAALRQVGDLDSGQVVLVGPSSSRLDAITDGVAVSGDTTVLTRSPDCPEEGPTAAGSADTGGGTYRVDSGTACYPAGNGATLAISQTHGGARLAVVGSGEFLTNGRLDQGGNAALGLNLLGGDGSADEVRWLVPAPGSATTDEQTSASDLLPSWVGLAVLQLLAAGLLAALWRARRLGPPVTEPLPVVVRSAEAVEGRARLYRRAQARDRAADALRAGARARLVPRLGLGHDAGGEPEPAAVVEVVTDWTGRSEADVLAALYGPPPPDDAALVTLADSLDSLVRDTLDPEVRRP